MYLCNDASSVHLNNFDFDVISHNDDDYYVKEMILKTKYTSPDPRKSEVECLQLTGRSLLCQEVWIDVSFLLLVYYIDHLIL